MFQNFFSNKEIGIVCNGIYQQISNIEVSYDADVLGCGVGVQGWGGVN